MLVPLVVISAPARMIGPKDTMVNVLEGLRKPQDPIERSNPGEARMRWRLYLKKNRPIR
jgi:hypothetical protein